MSCWLARREEFRAEPCVAYKSVSLDFSVALVLLFSTVVLYTRNKSAAFARSNIFSWIRVPPLLPILDKG